VVGLHDDLPFHQRLSRRNATLSCQNTSKTGHEVNNLATMAEEQKPARNDLSETIRQADRERWLFRPCDACGDKYRVWGTQVDLLPYCGGTKCNRNRKRQ
jgi:hypothetical protein